MNNDGENVPKYVTDGNEKAFAELHGPPGWRPIHPIWAGGGGAQMVTSQAGVPLDPIAPFSNAPHLILGGIRFCVRSVARHAMVQPLELSHVMQMVPVPLLGQVVAWCPLLSHRSGDENMGLLENVACLILPQGWRKIKHTMQKKTKKSVKNINIKMSQN